MLLYELLSRPLVLDEDVPIRDSHHMAAFAITVAEAYDAAPRVVQNEAPLWTAFNIQNEKVLFGQIAKAGVQVVFSDQDAYGIEKNGPTMALRYMLWDMIVNHRLIIWTGYSDTHPAMTSDQTVIFRAVHDYYGHGKLRATFKKQIEALGLGNRKPSADELTKLLPNIHLDKGGNIGHALTLRGEINAYLTHAKLMSPKIVPVLFTEIVGQSCYYTVVDAFPEQKAAVLHGFDYRRIGLGAHEAHPIQQRIDQLIGLLGSATMIETRISAKPRLVVAEILAKISR